MKRILITLVIVGLFCGTVFAVSPWAVIRPVTGATNAFEIGVTEVPNADYAEFLNAVASDGDSFGLWQPLMEEHFWGGIERRPNGQRWTYVCKPGYARKPVTCVTWFSCLRYCNWLHYGKPYRAVGGTWFGVTEGDTRFGAYDTRALTPHGFRVHRNFSARYWLPNLREWEAAAFADGKGGSFRYATRSNEIAGLMPTSIRMAGRCLLPIWPMWTPIRTIRAFTAP